MAPSYQVYIIFFLWGSSQLHACIWVNRWSVTFAICRAYIPHLSTIQYSYSVYKATEMELLTHNKTTNFQSVASAVMISVAHCSVYVESWWVYSSNRVPGFCLQLSVSCINISLSCIKFIVIQVQVVHNCFLTLISFLLKENYFNLLFISIK